MVGVGENQGLDIGEPGAAGKVLQVGIVVSLDVFEALEALAGKVAEVVDTNVQVRQVGQQGEGVVVDRGDLVV